MKFKEAELLLIDGKKITRRSWNKGDFIRELDNKVCFYDARKVDLNHYDLSWADEVAEDWEEYFEPKLKPNIEIPEEERKAFEEGFECASKLYEKRIKELEKFEEIVLK